MKNLEKNEKILLFLLFIGLLVVFVSKIVSFYTSKENIDNSIKIVTDQNRFFEVSACVNKFITYSQTDDTNKIISILNDNYIKENNITEDNVFDYLKHFNPNDVFTARKMFYQQIDKSIYKYYVYGRYREELLYSYGEEQNYYLIVYLYTDNMTFSIEPYNGELFEG